MEKKKYRSFIDIDDMPLSETEGHIEWVSDEIEKIKSDIPKNQEAIINNLPKTIDILKKIFGSVIINEEYRDQFIENAKKNKGFLMSIVFPLNEQEKKKVEELLEEEEGINRIIENVANWYDNIVSRCFFEKEKLTPELVEQISDWMKKTKKYALNKESLRPDIIRELSDWIKKTKKYTPKITGESYLTLEDVIELQDKFFKLMFIQEREWLAKQRQALIKRHGKKTLYLTNGIYEFKLSTNQYQNNLTSLRRKLKILKEHRATLKRRERSARLKAYQDKGRQGAATEKNRLKNQFKTVEGCPYCGKKLNFKDSHADHIYPVAKGGLTTSQNMVLVCVSCNSVKSKSTLRQFARKSKLDLDSIEQRLEKLGKEF